MPRCLNLTALPGLSSALLNPSPGTQLPLGSAGEGSFIGLETCSEETLPFPALFASFFVPGRQTANVCGIVSRGIN